ncbi:hypothetical protein [Pseudomonas prosekii]|uniref:hypothetical protein n=1 Tax=Pseudomonas prosekii TaxID=1148509 RepID=UPI00387B868A
MSLSPEKDKLLCAVLAHESILCRDAYAKFFDMEFMLAHSANTVEQIIIAHGTFQSFVHHLYEFCIALIQREMGSLDQIRSVDAEKHISVVIEKIWRIEQKNPLSHFHNMSAAGFYGTYSCFPKHFRQARNNGAHALIKRAQSGQSLAEFYSSYRMMIRELFSHLTQWWRNVDIEKTNWHDIGKFNIRAIALQEVRNHYDAVRSGKPSEV